MTTTHNIQIWQIKMADDTHGKVFSNYSEIINNFGAITLSDYTKIYNCRHVTTEVDNNRILDEIFSRFNTNRPKNYKGRSLSVSDIIVLDGIMYYVDSFGFKKIDIVK